MKRIKVEIIWSEKNYCCGWGYKSFGAVVCTNKTIDGLKSEFESSVKTQIEDMVAEGEPLPKWMIKGEYAFDYTLSASALLRQAERFTTMAVISRVTGINQKLLSHYANSIKKPREAQRERIVNGLHSIGQQFLSVH